MTKNKSITLNELYKIVVEGFSMVNKRLDKVEADIVAIKKFVGMK